MADEAEDLSPEQTEKLIQFQDLTRIEDINRCRQTLEQHNWDIEVAVQDTFNEQEGNPSVFREPPPEPRTPPVNLNPVDQRVFTVQTQQPHGIVQWGYYVLTFPFRFVYTTLLDLIRFAFLSTAVTSSRSLDGMFEDEEDDIMIELDSSTLSGILTDLNVEELTLPDIDVLENAIAPDESVSRMSPDREPAESIPTEEPVQNKHNDTMLEDEENCCSAPKSEDIRISPNRELAESGPMQKPVQNKHNDTMLEDEENCCSAPKSEDIRMSPNREPAESVPKEEPVQNNHNNTMLEEEDPQLKYPPGCYIIVNHGSSILPAVVDKWPWIRFYKKIKKLWTLNDIEHTIVEGDIHSKTDPPDVVMCGTRLLYKFTVQILRPDPRRNVTDPVGDVTRFIQSYNEKFGDTHPVFYQGSYSQALNDAKRELRFLLVYLHGPDHQDTDRFCQTTLGHSDVIDFVNVNMLFWACDTNSPEGYRVSQALRENTYPFLAFIVLRENKMTVVAKIEGPVEAQDLVQRMETIIGDNESSLVAARADREERSFNQSLRQQQDEAYLASLRADQEKARKKQEERDKELAELERIKQQEADESRMLMEREERKDRLREEMPPEPDKDDPSAIRVVLKLPDGTRIERRFLRNQSLKHLYYFTFCHEQCPDDFHIVTNFPRKTLPCDPTDCEEEPISFEEFGLGKNELLFVQDNDA